LLGATGEQLHTLYSIEAKEQEEWKESSLEITRDEWRNYLGRRDLQRSFFNFFEDELMRNQYDWKKVCRKYLLEGKEPLVNSLVADAAHPLIHLGYAFELDSREIATEALTLAATCYKDLHKLIDGEHQHRMPSTVQLKFSLPEMISTLHNDHAFDHLLTRPGLDNLDIIMKERGNLVIQYFHRLKVEEIDDESFDRMAALMLVATHKPNEPQYDFFLCHVLTSHHAMRVLLADAASSIKLDLKRQFWLFMLLAYLTQMRPKVDESLVDETKLDGKGWDFIYEAALKGDHSTDVHDVKALRSLSVCEKRNPSSTFWLQAAVKFAMQKKQWTGFGYPGEPQLAVRV